ncbi:MAG TPA: DUF3352 domain-containing protein [Solirubrobacteraceae bacterium]
MKRLPSTHPPDTAGSPPRARIALAFSLLALTGFVLAGCGSSSHTAGTSADPATAVPSSAPLYVGAVVRPTGDLRTQALAAGKALTHQADPYLKLLSVLQSPGSGSLGFGKDVAGWLGPNAAIFLTSLGSSTALVSLLEGGLLGKSGASFPFASGGAEGAIVMDTSDPDSARSFLTAQAKRAGAHPETYHGVSYEVTSGGLAFGLVARFAVIGTEAALHDVIDTTQGGTALDSTGSYKKLQSIAPSEALAHLYVNPLATPAGQGEGEGDPLLTLLTGSRVAYVSLLAKSHAISLDVDTLTPSTTGGSPAPAGLLSGEPRAASTLAALPGDSWLAIGLPKTAGGLAGDVAGLRIFGSLFGASGGPEAPGTLSLSSLMTALLKPLEVLGASTPQAKRDYEPWIGPVGVFAGGGSLLELHGAVVIDSTDPALSRAAVAKLGSALRAEGDTVHDVRVPGTEAAISAAVEGLPLPLYIGTGRDSSGKAKFVLGLGEASLGVALNPSTTLSASASRTAAQSSLGENAKPSFMLDTPTLLSLLEGVGLAESPSVSPVFGYLRAVSTVVAGGHELSGEAERFKLVISLAPDEEEAEAEP